MSNEVIKNLKERRSIKKYKPDLPKRELIEEVVSAGISAASGRNRQSAIVVAITDKGVRDRLSAANAALLGMENDPFYGAPCILVVLAKKECNTYIYDGSLVMGNMMSAAHSLGLGSCWVHRAKEVFMLDEWKSWLRSIGVEGEYEGIGNLWLGYSECEYPDPIPRNPDRVFFVD